MNYWRPKTYDVFDVMIYARRHVFVTLNNGEFLLVSALARIVEVARFTSLESDMLSSTYIERTAQELGLYDGKGWNLVKLATWLQNDMRTCPICGRAVTNKRATYDRAKCRQAAYRKRRSK